MSRIKYFLIFFASYCIAQTYIDLNKLKNILLKEKFTMIGDKRLNNIQFCVENVLKNNIAGDLIETGVWEGGATILMRAILKVNGDTNRKVWVADSFQGLPKPNISLYPADVAWQKIGELSYLSVSLDKVKSNFAHFGLLDSQVIFLKGWFKDSLPTAPIEKLAVLRLDGDLYESTIDALIHLYPKLSIGGYIIIDDYGHWPSCAQAINDYRKLHNIDDVMEKIDYTGVFWKKTK